jgi:hypothetical protein
MPWNSLELGELGGDGRGRLVHGHALELLVEEVVEHGELAGGRVEAERDGPVPHHARVRDHDAQHVAPAHADELQALDRLLLRLGREHHARGARDLREQPGRLDQQRVELLDAALIALLDALLLRGRQALHVGEVVHEEAVALVRGLAAGRGVRLGEEALVLEVLQDVADGRAGEVQPRLVGDEAGGHGLGGLDVVVDDPLEQVALALLDDLGFELSHGLSASY